MTLGMMAVLRRRLDRSKTPSVGYAQVKVTTGEENRKEERVSDRKECPDRRKDEDHRKEH